MIFLRELIKNTNGVLHQCTAPPFQLQVSIFRDLIVPLLAILPVVLVVIGGVLKACRS